MNHELSRPEPSALYIQITATAENGGLVKALVMLVPRVNIENFRSAPGRRMASDEQIAQLLAEPLATNLFTHRRSFGRFLVAHSFSTVPPPDIAGKTHEFEQDGLKAWIL
jgi:hypothetical protein